MPIDMLKDVFAGGVVHSPSFQWERSSFFCSQLTAAATLARMGAHHHLLVTVWEEKKYSVVEHTILTTFEMCE